VYLRIDTLEQAIRKLGGVVKADEGYQLGYSLAADNLALGISVVADSCNPIKATRRAWMDIASQTDSSHVNIEVVCSDADVHRQRVEHRLSDISGLELPTWQQVQSREYHRWEEQPIVVDTSCVGPEEALEGLLDALKRQGIHVGA
jgi:predicted kinase